MSGLAVTLRAPLPGFELDVSWEIGAELAVLFGPSGAGKSLTLRLIAGLAQHRDPRTAAWSRRAACSSTRPVGSARPPQRRSIGYVFQSPAPSRT